MTKNSNLTLKPLNRAFNQIRLLTIVALTCGVAIQPTELSASGDLDRFMGDMFAGTLSNATDPGYFKTQQRGVISGGSFVARVPIRQINIANFDPPRIDAGCGGINLFGGSFSFINMQEITQLLRTIAQNALGLLFSLAINAISQPLQNLLQVFQKKIQDMNALLKNSCEAARKIFTLDSTGKSVLNKMGEEMKSIKTAAGGFKDPFNGAFEQAKSGWDALRGKVDPVTNQGDTTQQNIQKLEHNGNITWKAVNASEVYSQLLSSGNGTIGSNGQQISPSTDDINLAKYLLMNVIGTEIIDPDQAKPNCPAGSTCEPKQKEMTRIFNFESLIDPKPGDNNFYICQDPTNGCKDVIAAPLYNYFKGSKYETNLALYGATGQEDSLTMCKNAWDQQKGIVGKAHLTAASLTPQEQRVFNALPAAVVAFAKTSGAQQMQACQMYSHVSDHLENALALNMANRISRAAAKIFSGKEYDAVRPKRIQENMETWNAEVAAKEIKLVTQLEVTDTLRRYAESVKMFNPNITVPISQR